MLELVREVANLRRDASEGYAHIGDHRSAGFELSRGARCLEALAQHLVETGTEPPSREHLLQLLSEAVQFRTSAIDQFRSDTGSSMSLSFELSYISKAAVFLRANFAEYRTPEIQDRMIGYRSEASQIFENYKMFRDAYFEYLYLTRLLMDKADADPGFYAPGIVSALKAVEMSREGKLDPFRIPEFYKTAAAAYRRLARKGTDGYTDFYREQAREMALKVLEAGDEADGIITLS